MINFINSLIAFVRTIFQTDQTYIYEVHEDLPKKLAKNKIYILGSLETPWMAAMQCPCGCKSTLNMNLIKTSSPCWKISANQRGEVSFHPSLWRKVGCKSHFFLRNGKVKWV